MENISKAYEKCIKRSIAPEPVVNFFAYLQTVINYTTKDYFIKLHYIAILNYVILDACIKECSPEYKK